MRIHVTRKLADKLKKAGHLMVDGPAQLDSVLDCWHANLVVIQRRNCLLFIHDQTRYAVALIGMTQKDLKQIGRGFEDMLVNSMMKLGYPSEFVERATRCLTPLEFDTQCDRSVHGTLRVAVQDLESYIWYGSDIMALGPYSLSAKLSERPCRIKGMKEMECLWPHKEMLKLLGQLKGLP